MEAPDSFKRFQPFLRRADELQTQVAAKPDLARIAYYTRMYVLEQGINLLGALTPAEQQTASAFLELLMGRIEQDRVQYNIAKDNEQKDLNLVRLYGLTLFKRADDADRAGCADNNTAKLFSAAANFFDVFRGLSKESLSDLDQMTKYAKARAADIVLSVKAGRQPAPPSGIDTSMFNELNDAMGSGDASSAPSVPTGMPSVPTSLPSVPSTVLPTTPSVPPALAPAPAPSYGISLQPLPPAAAPSLPATPSNNAAFGAYAQLPPAQQQPPSMYAQAPPSQGAAAYPTAAYPGTSSQQNAFGQAPLQPAYGQAPAQPASYGQTPAQPASYGQAPAQPASHGQAPPAMQPYATVSGTGFAATTAAYASPSAHASLGAAGRGNSFGRSGVQPTQLHDATEYTKHALAALKQEDVHLAAQFLRNALQTLGV